VYTGDGQVILPPNAYLKGTGLYSLPYTNFGMEVIMTQTSNTDQWRAIMHVGSEAWNAGFHLLVRKGDPRFMYRDDQVGEFVDSWAPIAVDTEYRLAIVVTPKPDGNVLKSCYLNGVLVGTRTDGPWNGWTMDDLWLGNCTQGPGWDGPYTTIKINEARVFHFAQGMFHPSLLLTAPTGGVTPPASSYASWASNMGIAGQPANGDADHDGVPNAVEMVLGGDPKNAMDAGLMPTLAAVTNPAGVPAGDYLEFTYRRTDLSVGAGVTAECQFNSDLGAAWTTAQDGVGGVKVLVTNNYAPYGAATARVQVYVPRAGHATLFARLHVAVP